MPPRAAPVSAPSAYLGEAVGEASGKSQRRVPPVAPGGDESVSWCSNCGRATTGSGGKLKLHRCGGCKRAVYCCKECQKCHWAHGGHKAGCKPPPELNPRSGANGGHPAAGHTGARSTRGCTTRPGAVCWICFDDTGELYDACACRGSAGAIDVECYYKFCKSNDRRPSEHIICSTCKQKFHGECRRTSQKLNGCTQVTGYFGYFRRFFPRFLSNYTIDA